MELYFVFEEDTDGSGCGGVYPLIIYDRKSFKEHWTEYATKTLRKWKLGIDVMIVYPNENIDFSLATYVSVDDAKTLI